ncbi:coatomer subunit beta [Biomphalaria glabrata]|nr:coatomer subunit beta [Biomphalaria glabrata]
MKLQIKRTLTSRSERVKCVDLHPSEPWMLTSLYNGHVYIWNLETKKVIKTLEVSNLPVRVVKFVSRKNWIVTGSDDRLIKVYNYNTLEHVNQFYAHLDFIRTIAVHPTHPFILTSGDDGVIRLWNWEKKWSSSREYTGHTYVVMQVIVNPKDNNQFASASLDKTVKVWQIGLRAPNFSLKHDRAVNCVEYHPGNDKPYLVTGEEGGAVRIWDYQTKSCVQILQGHTKDVNTVVFHLSLPLILSGGDDGQLCLWHSGTYRLEKVMNYGLERVWMITCQKASSIIAAAFDEGCMALRIGSEEPPISMDLSGKILWAKHAEIQQANVKVANEQEIKDGERLLLAIKDMGTCDIYPLTISHSPNGRFAVVCGEGEYIIYTALTLRSKSYGSATEFVWATDSSMYAISNGNTVTIYKNFKEFKTLKPALGVEGLYGGHLLGVRSTNSLTFYTWETVCVVRHIELEPKHVFWNESNTLVCLSAVQSFHILQYNPESLEPSSTTPDGMSEDGNENSFEVLHEIAETVTHGLWIGDCFVYTNNLNRLRYYVGGEVTTVAYLDRPMYLLGYISKENRVYLGDKELNIVSYRLWTSVLEYQTAVVRKDFDSADKVLPSVPLDQRNTIAQFLESQGFKKQALAVSNDLDHKFDLSIQLGDLQVAYSLAKQCDTTDKWKELADVAMKKSDLALAQECLQKAQDWEGLLLIASSTGNRELMMNVSTLASLNAKTNVEFLANYSLGRCEDCLEILIQSGRLPEAALFAHTYLPSEISRVVVLWQEKASTINKRLAKSIAEPKSYENLFPNYQVLLKTQEFLKAERSRIKPASSYSQTLDTLSCNPVEEMMKAECSGAFVSSQLLNAASEVDEDVEGFVTIQSLSPGEESPFDDLENDKDILIPSHVQTLSTALLNELTPESSTSAAQLAGGTASEEVPGHQINFDTNELWDQELEIDLENLNIDDFDIADLNLDGDEFLFDDDDDA